MVDQKIDMGVIGVVVVCEQDEGEFTFCDFV